MPTVPPRRLAAGAAGLAVVLGVTAFNELVVRSGPAPAGRAVLVAIAAIAAVTGLAAGWPTSRRYLEPFAVIVAAASAGLSLVHFSGDTPREATWLLAEMAAVLVLLVLVVRLAPARRAIGAGAAAAAAQLLMVLRVATPADVVAWSGAALMWGSGAVAAIVLGLYLRMLDGQRERSVADARRAQRLELARDLHDFVAHDVTGMVVQAQAAQVVAATDPDAALSALRRVEEAGLHALGSLDRTVRMLGELAQPPSSTARPATLDDVVELADRFSANDGTPVELALDPHVARLLTPPVADTVRRIVLEALTNVRRHAPSATQVAVHVARHETRRGSAVAVTVRDDAPAGPVGAAVGGNGSGLIALRERVECLGGTLRAGPSADGAPGWTVSAMIPLADQGRS